MIYAKRSAATSCVIIFPGCYAAAAVIVEVPVAAWAAADVSVALIDAVKCTVITAAVVMIAVAVAVAAAAAAVEPISMTVLQQDQSSFV